ncbi:MAG: hypothetical protein JXE07_09715, partial [Candidatus Aminicenantes bacterium]|nr:hypothetical protein [Candidatus Aminicenantes bacterium]
EFRRTPRGPIGLQNINTLTAGNFPFRDDFPARVLAYKGDVDGAIAEYERIIISIHIGGRLVHPFARHRLAGLAERKGLTAEALAQYRKLAGIWNDADPDLEIVRSMRASLTALKTR